MKGGFVGDRLAMAMVAVLVVPALLGQIKRPTPNTP